MRGTRLESEKNVENSPNDREEKQIRPQGGENGAIHWTAMDSAYFFVAHNKWNTKEKEENEKKRGKSS